MYQKALKMYLIANQLVSDQRGELDEKALLIALFVIAAIAGLSTLAAAVSDRFISLAASL